MKCATSPLIPAPWTNPVEKVWRNLDRSGGYHGALPRPRGEPAVRAAKTLQQIGELWLAQHTGKPGTVEGYQPAMSTCIQPELT